MDSSESMQDGAADNLTCPVCESGAVVVFGEAPTDGGNSLQVECADCPATFAVDLPWCEVCGDYLAVGTGLFTVNTKEYPDTPMCQGCLDEAERFAARRAE